MRNFLLLLAVIATTVFCVNKVTAQYCTSGMYGTGANNGCNDDDFIQSFSTTGGVTNITNNNTGCSNTTPQDAYTYFSGMTHTAVQGATVNFSLTATTEWGDGYKIWVDFNNNGSFEDAGELVFSTPTAANAGAVFNSSFTIPIGTVPGLKRLRVRSVFNTTAFTSCSNHTFGEIEDYNLQVVALAACTGTPNAGTATSTITNILCPGANFTLGLSGSDLTSNLTYQWFSSPDNVNWTPIAGATNFNHTLTQSASIMYYRAEVTCTNAGGGMAPSGSVAVTNGSGPTYAPLPFTESFENTWMNTCNTREIPNNTWRNTPGTGNNSWRRNDDGGAAAWTTPANGAYTPASSDGAFSARFHSNDAAAASTGRFDLHLNCSSPATAKRLLFDFINADGNDSLSIHISTDGGGSFTRLDSVRNSTVWRKKAVIFNSNSATTIIRFIAYSDNGSTDIGIDNAKVTDFDDCNGTPVGGTASSNAPASVCAGVPFTLTVTGQTDANLLTYQWEVSIDGGANYNPIPGATSETLTISQVTTSLYRLRITCNNAGGGTTTSFPVTVNSPMIPAGEYTINKNAPNTWPSVGANFTSFAAAYAAMSCGIGDHVVFRVVAGSGPYNEQLIISPIINASANRTVTFKGNLETITHATSTGERAVVKLKGADHIRIDSLVITSTGTTNTFGVQLYNNADSNIISNNIINVAGNVTSNTVAGIVMSGSETDPIGAGTTTALIDANQILNNTINGGFYGVTLTATFAGGANGNNLIKGNTIRDFYQYGIYVSASYNTIIDSNRINRPNRTAVSTTSFDGIYFTNQSNLCTISRNRVTNPFGGLAGNSTAPFNGIHFNAASASAGNDNIVVNNLVAEATKTTGAVTAFNNNNSSSVSYFHNTISLDDVSSTANSATRGLWVQSSPTGVLFYNNNVSVTRGGPGQKHGIYLGGGLLLGSDYNNVYVSGSGANAHFGFYTANRTTLAAWKAATIAANLDASSLAINPVYLNPASGDYCSANAAVNDKGLYIGVDVDINGNTRNAATPDIGAFECTPPPCSIPPVSGATVVTPTTICQGLPVTLDLNIGAFGSGQTFQWQISKDNGATWINITAPLQTPGTSILADTTGLIRAEIACVSSIVHTAEIPLTVIPAFVGGTYTIDTTGTNTYIAGGPAGTNFRSFNRAYKEMATCGILDDVTFNVVPATGPYAERLKMDSIRGASATDIITFNGNGETITFDPALPPTNTERAVIKLIRADHIKFNNLVINASNGPAYGYGVQLVNNADSNAFRNCTIISSPTSASNAYSGVIINSTETTPVTPGTISCDGNVFEGNTIRGGFYGITLVGSATASAFNNRIAGNIIEDFYSTGIYVAGTTDAVIDSNVIARPNRVSATTITGIFSTAVANNNLHISRNSIRNLVGANTATGIASPHQQYGIYHNIDQATGSASVVYNNLISDLGGLGIIYGLYNSGADNVHYYHNTISLDSSAFAATGVTRGYFQQGQALGLDFKNNIITIKRGGNAVKNAIYLDNTTSTLSSDYNVFWVSGSNAHIGFYPTTNRTTFLQWQQASGQDVNSINTDPLYQNPAIIDYRPSIQTVDNLGTTATSIPVPADIKAVFRSTPPDMGAFEFVPIPCGTPVAGTASVTPSSNICLTDPITLDITGHSQLGTLTFQWFSAPTAAGPFTTVVSPIQYGPQFNTTIGPETFFRAEVACGPNKVYTNVVQVVLNSVVMQGTYTIGNGPTTWNGTPPTAGNDNFATFTDAVNAMACGITGPVVFKALNGTYNEQIRINRIRNSSNINTITFESQSGNVADVNLTFNAAAAGTNYTLKLDSAHYVTFRNMTITATNTSFGRVVDIANTAAYDSIVRCNIVAPVVTTTANTASAIYANALKGSNLIIKRNNITNGSNGINFSGTSNTNLALPGHLIDSNTVSSSFHTGILVQFTNDMVISNNTVDLTGPLGANAAGINTNYADSGYRIHGNKVNINNSTVTTYGLYVQNSRSVIADSGIIRSNIVVADAGNTGTVYGMTVTLSKNLYMVNNTAGINSSGATAYGMHSLNNTETVNWYNNSSQITNNATNGYAAYFNHTAGGTRVYNNIFANKGTGRAMYVNNPGNYFADYNMLHSGGVNLVQTATGAPTNFTSLLQWKNSWNWDRNSLTGRPAFISNTDMRPDIANDSSWLMHGRGVQIPNNSYDFNGNYRPQTLTEGVPDLGAYEFYPTVQPTVLRAIPLTPAAGVEQTFYYGSDTVMRIKWGATAPPSIEVRRFSGVVPPGLQVPPRPDSMYFYTSVDIPGLPLSANNHPYSAKLYYVESWMASIPEEYMIGMGRKLASNAWVVGFNSKNNLVKNEITQESLNYYDLFTGLINPVAQKDSDDSTSNRGKDFWVGYQRTNGFTQGNTQEMVLYFGANNQEAHVTVTIEGTSGSPWVQNYTVPANSAISSAFIPKAGANNATLLAAGFHDNQGIHIESDVPIVAYAHIYEGANSGATMLMPTTVWGYEYFTLSSRQNYTSTSYSVFHIVAKEDSTWVEINPSKPTLDGWVQNGGTQPNGSYLVKLNKGDIYQVIGANISGNEGQDLSGSYVKSISNNQNQCFPIAVFSGSTRTGIGCGTTAGSSGDLIIQQIFPYQAWGTKYATAPTSNDAGPNAGSNMTNIYRVLVKDPTTIVKRNNTTIPLAQLIAGRYYQFESNTADYIESNKPVLVAQYMSSNGACANTGSDGDPEMFYLSPLEQAIKSTQFYRNNQDLIDENFITLVIPTEGLTSLRIDGVNWQTYPAGEVYAANHLNLPGYSTLTKRWAAGTGSSIVESDHAFTGIVYGLGSVESYGYNLGTLVRNLNNLSDVDNVLDTAAQFTGYTCENAPFTFTALLSVEPDSIKWHFSALPWLNPHVDSIQYNPVAYDTIVVDGVQYFAYTVNVSFTSDSTGIFKVPITYYSPELESCDKSRLGYVVVQVLPAPITDFQVTFSGGNPQACEGDVATFTADIVTANGIAVNEWEWTFHTGATPTGQIQTLAYPTPGTYTVKLRGITADGCISDTTRTIEVNAKPTVTVTSANINICPGDDATFSVSSPLAGATYNWYNVATGGTILGTGTSYTATGVTPPASFFVEGISSAGCVSVTRAEVTASTLPQLAQPVVTVTGSTANTVTFGWTAIAGATSYQVSTDNGTTWITPSSGATGLSHTVSGLGTLAQTCIMVRVLGPLTCQTNTSASVCGCSNSSAQVITPIVSVCTGTSASFTIQSPVVGVTYNWYATATGGAILGTGTTFNSPAVSGTTNYYVEQVSGAGCVGSPRTQVTANILPPLAVPTVTAESTVNSITWTWQPVPNAASYQVSLDNGTTWIAPSSGATGLTHTVTGLAPVVERCLIVRAIGTIACQTSQSAALCKLTKPDAIFIPNTFTPNNDGKNDALVAYGWAIQSVQFMVFNQWGEKIHEVSTAAQDGATGGFVLWDGKYKGTIQPVGVYVYTAKIVLKDGTILNKTGPLNIVR